MVSTKQLQFVSLLAGVAIVLLLGTLLWVPTITAFDPALRFPTQLLAGLWMAYRCRVLDRTWRTWHTWRHNESYTITFAEMEPRHARRLLAWFVPRKGLPVGTTPHADDRNLLEPGGSVARRA